MLELAVLRVLLDDVLFCSFEDVELLELKLDLELLLVSVELVLCVDSELLLGVPQELLELIASVELELLEFVETEDLEEVEFSSLVLLLWVVLLVLHSK